MKQLLPTVAMVVSIIGWAGIIYAAPFQRGTMCVATHCATHHESPMSFPNCYNSTDQNKSYCQNYIRNYCGGMGMSLGVPNPKRCAIGHSGHEDQLSFIISKRLHLSN